MSKPIVGWFEITGFAFVADPEGRVVGLSKRAVQ
jgi:hypothetical protein